MRLDEHLVQIDRILKALRAARLTIRLEKCKFFMSGVQFLGFRISREGIQPGTRKVTAISEFPTPRTVHEMGRFLGLTSFFRRFVRNYAAISGPLTELLKQKAPNARVSGKKPKFVWTDAANEAFESLNAKLASEPVSGVSRPKLPKLKLRCIPDIQCAGFPE